jgi:uncharacterized protein (DUF736 family)
MAIIGTFSKAKTGGWEGKIRMLSAVMSARFVPNHKRETDAAPNLRLLSDCSELGAAWVRRSGADNTEFLSVQLDDPTFERPISAALFYADGGERAHLVWHRRQKAELHDR